MILRALAIIFVGWIGITACRASPTPIGADPLAPYVPSAAPTRMEWRDLRLEELRADPAGLEAEIVRDRLVTAVLGPRGSDVLAALVAEWRRLGERAVRGLSRDERNAEENIRTIFVAAGTPESLRLLPAAELPRFRVGRLAAWATMRVAPDPRGQTARLEMLVAELDAVVREHIADAVEALVGELQLAILPPPHRPLLVQIAAPRILDGAAVSDLTRAAVRHQMQLAVQQVPGLMFPAADADPLAGNATHSLRASIAADGLVMEFVHVPSRELIWQQTWTWPSSAQFSAMADNTDIVAPNSSDNIFGATRHEDSAIGIPEVFAVVDRRRVSQMVADLALRLTDGGRPVLASGLRNATAFRVWVDPFRSADSASDIAAAVRRQLIAELASRPQFVLVAHGDLPASGASSDLPLLRLSANLSGRWERGRFICRVSISLRDFYLLSTIVWTLADWPLVVAPTADIFRRPSDQ